MPNIFISIVNYNGNKDTSNCLKSLNEIAIKDFILSVIVVDNNSKEPFEEDKNLYKNFSLEIIKSKENLGFSGGQNLGIKKALEKNAHYIVVLNNDVILDKNFIAELLKTFEKEKKCGIVSPKIYFAKGHEFHKDRYKKEDLGKVIWYAGGKMDWKNLIASHRGVDEVDKGQYQLFEKTDFASGCCMMIKREVFEKTGFFDEKYFLYYEDNDLSQRAIRSNFFVFYQPDSFLWHINAGSTGGSGSLLQDYYITRNRLLFGFKYAPARTMLALFRESILLFIKGRYWQRVGVRDYYFKKFS